MNNLNILSSIFRRLSSIERYSTTPKITEENVATHSYCVTLLCMYFAIRDSSLDGLKMMQMSQIHDCDESIGGDITMDLKRMNSKARETLEIMAEEVVDIILGEIEEKPKYISLWQEYKARTTREAKMVKVADIVSKVFLMKTEYEMGNTYAIPILSTIRTELLELDAPKWVLDEVCEILDNLGIKHKTFEEIR